MTDTGRVEAGQAADLLLRAAEANRTDPFRRHGLVHLPNYGQVVLTGDMHGNRANFAKLARFAMLDRASVRHVILHELIHADTPPGGLDMSHELLLDAARWKCEFPEQVHFLQSNHELSQLTDHQILKGGRVVIEDFRRAVESTFGPAGGQRVYDAMLEFLASFPVAARTANRVWVSHSLPAPDELETFDFTVFERELRPDDLRPGGAVYQLVWGRRFTTAQLAELGRRWEVDSFVVGHIPQDYGYDVRLGRVLILASDHNHGVFLPLELSRPQQMDDLVAAIRKFVAVP